MPFQRNLANFLASQIFRTHHIFDDNGIFIASIADTAGRIVNLIIALGGHNTIAKSRSSVPLLDHKTTAAPPDEPHHDDTSTETTEEKQADDHSSSGSGSVSHRFRIRCPGVQRRCASLGGKTNISLFVVTGLLKGN